MRKNILIMLLQTIMGAVLFAQSHMPRTLYLSADVRTIGGTLSKPYDDVAFFGAWGVGLEYERRLYKSVSLSMIALYQWSDKSEVFANDDFADGSGPVFSIGMNVSEAPRDEWQNLGGIHLSLLRERTRWTKIKSYIFGDDSKATGFDHITNLGIGVQGGLKRSKARALVFVDYWNVISSSRRIKQNVDNLAISRIRVKAGFSIGIRFQYSLMNLINK